MDYAIRLIKAISPAIVIVAVAAFLLGALYETCFAYTEIYDQIQTDNSGNIPTAIGLTNHYYHAQQSFTTGATTTNLTSFLVYGHYHAGKCNGSYPTIQYALCDGETPGSINDVSGQTNYNWPCNGTTSWDAPLGNSTITSIFGTTGHYATTTFGYVYDLVPNHQYYMDFRWYEPNTDDPCLTLAYMATDHYTGGRLFGGDNDLQFKTMKYAEYIASSSGLFDPSDIIGTSSPMIHIADTNPCCFSDSSACHITVWYNDAAVARNEYVFLSEYNSSYLQYMDMVQLDYDHNGEIQLEYTPKEGTGAANQIVVTESWNNNGHAESRDHIANMDWNECGNNPLAGYTVQQYFAYGDCACTEQANLLECGLKKAGCWAFQPGATTTALFNQAKDDVTNGFPFNTFKTVQLDLQNQQMTKSGVANANISATFPIYFFGFPNYATSTYMGGLNFYNFRVTLESFGFSYIYLIMEYSIWLSFFGLVLWRLWRLITKDDPSDVYEGMVSKKNKGTRSKKDLQVDLRNKDTSGYVVDLRNK